MKFKHLKTAAMAVILIATVSCESSNVDGFVKTVDLDDGVLLNFILNLVPPVSSQKSSIRIIHNMDIIDTGTGVFDFGNTELNVEKQVVFTINNTGTTDLILTGSPEPVQIIMGNGDFSVKTRPETTVMANNGNSEFKISYKPTSVGNKTAIILIANSSSDIPIYTFTLSGNGITPSISLFQGTTPIINETGSVNFGNIPLNTEKQINFRIINSGAADLVLTNSPTSVQIIDVNGRFSMQSQPVSPVASNNGYSDFTISFKPTSAGDQTATVNIANDSIDTPVYSFMVKGKGINSIASWINNGIDEPAITGSTGSSLTIQWPPITGAERYDIYYFTATDASDEVKITDTADTNIMVTTSQKYVKIKAVDSGSNVLDSWVISQEFSHYVSTFVSGTFNDNFNDGIFNPLFYIYNSGQASESGGYLQLNQNITDNGPWLLVGYDPEGKRYVHFSVKCYQHRNNNYYYGRISTFSSLNNFDQVNLGNYHGDYPAYYGTYFAFVEYNPHNFQGSGPSVQLNSIEYFDQWFTWDVYIDTVTGLYRVKINNNEFTSYDTPYLYNGKIIFEINPYGWNTGHYIRLDDLLIESSDTPY